jgi:hypothetical protein
MATQQAIMMSSKCNNKRSLEERAGLNQPVKDLTDTGISRVPPLVQFTATDFLKRSLYSKNNDRMQNVHSIFAAGLERRRRAALLGYDDDGQQQQKGSEVEEPPAKRRRFQRRNSKTPAMLFKSMSFLPQDLFNDENSATTEATKNMATEHAKATQEDDDDWDGGLEIAEQIVQHLQKRRASDADSH